jgi:hypothetical protein
LIIRILVFSKDMCLCPFEPELQRLFAGGHHYWAKIWMTDNRGLGFLSCLGVSHPPHPPNDSLSSLLLFTLLLHWKTIHVICLFVCWPCLPRQGKTRIFIVFRLIIEL